MKNINLLIYRSCRDEIRSENLSGLEKFYSLYFVYVSMHACVPIINVSLIKALNDKLFSSLDSSLNSGSIIVVQTFGI